MLTMLRAPLLAVTLFKVAAPVVVTFTVVAALMSMPVAKVVLGVVEPVSLILTAPVLALMLPLNRTVPVGFKVTVTALPDRLPKLAVPPVVCVTLIAPLGELIELTAILPDVLKVIAPLATTLPTTVVLAPPVMETAPSLLAVEPLAVTFELKVLFPASLKVKLLPLTTPNVAGPTPV